MSLTCEQPVSISFPEASGEKSSPLTYYYNGNFLTLNPAAPRSSHMLVAGDRIWHCNDSADSLGLNYRRAGFNATRRDLARDVHFVDLQGKTVIPGLVDAHVHFIWWGLNLILADLSRSRSEADAINILRNFASRLKPNEWLVGFGWSHNLWEDQNLPGKASLDSAFPDNPVYLSSKCGHVAWVNSAALAAGGITDSTPDPFGGEIARRDGKATGILKETANSLVYDRIGAPTEDRRLQALRQAQRLAHSLGITGMQTPEDLDTWAFLQRANADNELTMRVSFWIPCAALDSLESLKLQQGFGSNRLRIGAVKLFSDGSLGGRTALMYDPYEGESENCGICVTSRDEIREITLRANRAGLPMAIHAIGDKAVDNVLAAYETSAETLGVSGAAGIMPRVRNRIEHLQVFSDRDLERIKALKPVASMQPIHLCADMGPADRYWGKRSRYAYAFRTLKDAGCTLAFGSDAPVEPINPFYGMYAASTRRNLEGMPEQGWYPEEKIGVDEALFSYTRGCAIADGQSANYGDLSGGKLADFVVLPEDPLSVPPEQLRDMRPVATFSSGKCVFRSEEYVQQPT